MFDEIRDATLTVQVLLLGENAKGIPDCRAGSRASADRAEIGEVPHTTREKTKVRAAGPVGRREQQSPQRYIRYPVFRLVQCVIGQAGIHENRAGFGSKLSEQHLEFCVSADSLSPRVGGFGTEAVRLSGLARSNHGCSPSIVDRMLRRFSSVMQLSRRTLSLGTVLFCLREWTMRLFRTIVVALIACLAPGPLLAAQPAPRSILVFDQSDTRGPFYSQIFSGLRSTVNANAGAGVTIYLEDLDLSRFNGGAYEESLRVQLEQKYRDRPVGVLVAVGYAALERVLPWRAERWPGIPVVFGMVDEPAIAALEPMLDVTGSIIKLRSEDAMI